MRWKLFAAATVAVLAVGPAMACGGPPVCTVVDPTGTPLNVRSAPGGKILANLRNGQEVEVIEHQDFRGKRWAHVARFEYMEPGWVFARYLKCKPAQGAGGLGAGVLGAGWSGVGWAGLESSRSITGGRPGVGIGLAAGWADAGWAGLGAGSSPLTLQFKV